MPNLSNHFLASNFRNPRVYPRNGKDVVLDVCRNIFVPLTPEEIVRQKCVEFLVSELGFPLFRILTEVPLAHFDLPDRGRVDIIVHNLEAFPMIIVECKAPNVALTEDVVDQAIRYFDAIGAGYTVIGIVNGLQEQWFRCDDSGNLETLDSAPRFADLEKGVYPSKQTAPEPLKRPSVLELSETDIGRWKQLSLLGEGSPREHLQHWLNIAGLLYLEEGEPDLVGRTGRFTFSGTGISCRKFGNAAGGSWAGDYRYFVTSLPNGNSEIVSLAVMGMMLVTNHPKYGNTNGHTVLLVAVDDGAKSHLSLELDLDKYVEFREARMNVWHSGALTRGKRGSAKRSEVIEFMRNAAPHLVDGNRVTLGSLPINRLIGWKDAQEFIDNCIEYALLRDEIRAHG